MTPLLHIEKLHVNFMTETGVARAVNGITFSIEAGRTLGVVGESGCGKSVTARAILRLIEPPGWIEAGRILFNSKDGVVDLAQLPQKGKRINAIRGAEIAMIFQEPMTALNTVMQVGRQIAEVLVLHKGIGWAEAGDLAIGKLAEVGINSPKERAASYPHQLSGGMRQRAMIAMALACEPALLIADEPTTALDVTIQAQILDLMRDLQDRIGMAIQFISHNLAVVSELAHEIIVMYAGRIVERAPADDLFANPLHPYTRGLIATLPNPDHRVERLPVITGGVPDLDESVRGCRFADRCPLADAGCRDAEPPARELAPGHAVACFKAAA